VRARTERVVLVVEDDPDLRMLLCAALTLPELADLGPVEILAAPDAETAFALFDGRAPELVLLDLDLSGEDGLALCRRLRAALGPRRVPVVAVSGFGARDDARERARSAGCDGYLVKPFDLDELLAAVRRYLGPQRGAANLPGSGRF
jgi:two-component system cell cycle response regulator DivK